MKTQDCSTEGCVKPAAFTTRTRPAWCIDCLDNVLHEGGFKRAEPFPGPKAWWLTTCLTCGVQAHYRLDYIRENTASGQNTCRACFWKARAAENRNHPWKLFERTMLELLREYSPEQILEAQPTPEVREFLESGWCPRERIIAHLDQHGFDLVATILDVTGIDDPVVIQCRNCKRISVDRMSDIGWGCPCSRKGRASDPTSPRLGRILLTESESPALDWWDHERNDKATLDTATVRATRTCHWVCPECGLRFEAKVSAMTTRPKCPECYTRWSEEWDRQWALWKITAVADVPELAAAWAGDDDPRNVMVAGGSGLFRCPMGHRVASSPLTFLESGCPICRGAETKAQPDKKWLADILPEIAAQWHPIRNKKLTTRNVVFDSTRTVWWRADCCGHEWQERVRDRDKRQRLRCPNCRTTDGDRLSQVNAHFIERTGAVEKMDAELGDLAGRLALHLIDLAELLAFQKGDERYDPDKYLLSAAQRWIDTNWGKRLNNMIMEDIRQHERYTEVRDEIDAPTYREILNLSIEKDFKPIQPDDEFPTEPREDASET
jgi:hypothetical protein